jgi:C4-dicarboxylate-specific signal transduction histidine kinase
MRGPFSVEFRRVAPDGSIRWIKAMGRATADLPGQPARLTGIVIDVTAEKAAELRSEEQRRDMTHLARVALLGELSGAVAHELNQPLTAILSNAQAAQRFLAQAPPDMAEVGDILADIVAEDKRAGEVIRRLRALYRKGEAQLQPVDLNEVAREVLQLTQGDLIAREVSVTTRLAAILPTVRGDRVQLQQVLLNLIVNACDAMSAIAADERALTIATARDGADAVQVSIADRGPGIAVDMLDRLFQPFVTTKPQGLGLGLSICRSIVMAHGGRLWADNNPERGATFSVALPAEAGLRQ